MSFPAAFIVEGQCEFDSLNSFIAKILGPVYLPVSNAKGIGNIIANTHEELLLVIQYHEPQKVIILLDYRDALRENLVTNCIQLKEMVLNNCRDFFDSQSSGSLILPEEIVVVVVDKTFETWVCADYEALKANSLFDSSKITETYSNVDEEIPNPCKWIESKLKKKINIKCRSSRKLIYKTIRPEIAACNSRSFRKFYKEVKSIKIIPD
jgi:hypothetical protein